MFLDKTRIRLLVDYPDIIYQTVYEDERVFCRIAMRLVLCDLGYLAKHPLIVSLWRAREDERIYEYVKEFFTLSMDMLDEILTDILSLDDAEFAGVELEWELYQFIQSQPDRADKLLNQVYARFNETLRALLSDSSLWEFIEHHDGVKVRPVYDQIDVTIF